MSSVVCKSFKYMWVNTCKWSHLFTSCKGSFRIIVRCSCDMNPRLYPAFWNVQVPFKSEPMPVDVAASIWGTVTICTRGPAEKTNMVFSILASNSKWSRVDHKCIKTQNVAYISANVQMITDPPTTTSCHTLTMSQADESWYIFKIFKKTQNKCSCPWLKPWRPDYDATFRPNDSSCTTAANFARLDFDWPRTLTYLDGPAVSNLVI